MAGKANPEITARNLKIAEARRTGAASLGQLADQYGISRERVRQISDRLGVDSDAAADAYARHKTDVAFEQAEQYSSVILMRFIAGESVPEIARGIGMQIKVVQEVLDEQVTDAVIAARARNHTAKLFPDVEDGPRENVTPRNDRHWTVERVFASLVQLARENGRLPSSTQYQRLAPAREDLPSFATVRNRLGRWSSVRVDVHHALKEA